MSAEPKPYGWDVLIFFHDGTSKRFGKVGSATAVMRWAMLKRLAKGAELTGSYTKEQWHRVWGHGGKFDVRR